MITYKDSGVDIDKGNRFAQKIKDLVAVLPKKGVVDSIGGFSGIVDSSVFGENLLLALSTDGVGTKIDIAIKAKKHDTIGIDLVAMNVNDIIASGAIPAFFLDYIAYSDLSDGVLEDIMKGIVNGLKQASAALVGGETAQMPDIYKKGYYDLAGFCVGVLKKEELLPRVLNEGLVLIGFASSGFHSNGYSLLRKLFFEKNNYSLDSIVAGKPLGEILLKPTTIYVSLFKKIRQYVFAAAHITGGGFYDNINRVLGKKFDAVIEKDRLPEVDIFKVVQKLGGISDKEMYRTFNMGVGFVVAVDEKDKTAVIDISKEEGIDALEIGYIAKGKGEVNIV